MKKLLESLEADFDDAEGWIRIVDADWIADDLKLNLSVRHPMTVIHYSLKCGLLTKELEENRFYSFPSWQRPGQ